jgi:AraC-like DNA-binding protein
LRILAFFRCGATQTPFPRKNPEEWRRAVGEACGMQHMSIRAASPETARPARSDASAHDMRPAFEARATTQLLTSASDIAGTDDLALLLVHLDGAPLGIRFGEHIGEEVLVAAGDAILLAAHTPLRLRLSSPVTTLALEFSENLVRNSPLPSLGRRRGHHAVHSGRAAHPARIVGTARLLAADIRSDIGGHAFRSALALAIVECIACDETLVRYREETASDYTTAGIERALNLIEKNLSVPVSLDWLASEAGISPFHLSRSFRRITGLSIQGYLRERRLKEACRLLSETRKPLAEIAYDCGFSSQSRMTTVFRQTMDTTPLAYRQRCWHGVPADAASTKAG